MKRCQMFEQIVKSKTHRGSRRFLPSFRFLLLFVKDISFGWFSNK